jgi:hypothetical protein
MLLEDVNNAQTYLYIKILTGLSGKFKVGDYIKKYGHQYDDTGDDDVLRWGPEKQRLAAFRSRIDNNRNLNIFYVPVYKVTKLEDGYMEVVGVNPFPDNKELPFYANEHKDIMGHELTNEIENYLENLNYRDAVVEEAIEHFLGNYIKLDEDYADSIIFESVYTPYNNSIDLKESLQRIDDAEKSEEKELLRRRALKGHATRRIRALRAATEAARAARAVARLKRLQVAKKKTVKTKKRK